MQPLVFFADSESGSDFTLGNVVPHLASCPGDAKLQNVTILDYVFKTPMQRKQRP
jgi:hypothetical protein